MEILKLLYDYFPMAVDTGKCLVFISEEWRIELTEHKNTNFGQLGEQVPLIRVRIFQKTLSGEFIPGHYEDFQLGLISKLAEEIERFIQGAIGKNIRENV